VLVIAGLGALAWSVAERLVASASPGGGSAASCTTLTLACPGAQAYVAVPGDTVWSIAVRFAHGGDPDRWSSGWRPRLTAVFYSPGNGWPCPEP